MISHNHCSGSSRATGPSESTGPIFMTPIQIGNDGRTEEVIKELAAIFVGMEAVVNVGAQARVDMTVIELSVEDKEDLVCAATQVS